MENNNAVEMIKNAMMIINGVNVPVGLADSIARPLVGAVRLLEDAVRVIGSAIGSAETEKAEE